MNRKRVGTAIAAVGVVAAAWSVDIRADIKANEKNRIEFAGALGKVVNFFGGKAAREGVTSTVAVKGNRKATLYENSAQIIDLDEEKVYDLDLDKKTYKVTTFDELRRKMEEDRRRAEEQARKDQDRQSTESKQPDQNAKEIQVDFDVKSTGQTKAINGFDAKEAVMTISVHEKGKTLEQSGGLVLTSDMWLAPAIPQMKEIAEFDLRYAQKLAGPMLQGASPQQLAMALAQYPGMQDAIAKMRAEGGKMAGTPILTTTTFDAVKSAEQMEQEKKSAAEPDSSADSGSGVSGMLGGFARRMAKKKNDSAQDAQPKARATFLTMTNEVLKVEPAVSAADLAIPAGFKEKK